MAKYEDQMIQLKVGDKNGTAIWISESRALTAYHTFQSRRSELSDEQRKNETPFFVSVRYKWQARDCGCRIVAHSERDEWDFAVIELDTRELTNAGIEPIAAAVDWLSGKSWESLSLFIGGYPLRDGTPSQESLTTKEKQLGHVSQISYAVGGFKRVCVNRVEPSLNENWDGISGGPVFDENSHQLVGIVSQHFKSLQQFRCVETAEIAGAWPELKKAIGVYYKGICHLEESNWGAAKKKLDESKRLFEKEAAVKVPELLENLIITAETLQLLEEKGSARALEVASGWVSLREAVEAYHVGRNHLKEGEWDKAKKRLEEAGGFFERTSFPVPRVVRGKEEQREEIRLPTPRVLTNMITTAEVLQLLNEEKRGEAVAKAASWKPLEEAVRAYIEGASDFADRKWDSVEKKFKVARDYFEKIEVQAPGVLEKMIAMAEAQRFLGKGKLAAAIRELESMNG